LLDRDAAAMLHLPRYQLIACLGMANPGEFLKNASSIPARSHCTAAFCACAAALLYAAELTHDTSVQAAACSDLVVEGKRLGRDTHLWSAENDNGAFVRRC
jgi:hypothetical protein